MKINLTTNTEGYLVFKIDAQLYAFPISQIKEVVSIPKLTPLPDPPPNWEGLMNLRGTHISILNLRTRLGYHPEPAKFKTAILLMKEANDKNKQAAGIIVDEILSVEFPQKIERQINSPSLLSKEVFILDNKTILILSLENILDGDLPWNIHHL